MPTFAIVRIVTWVLLMTGATYLIRRRRLMGVAIAILAGWLILVFAYKMWPAPPEPNDWDEDAEDIPIAAPIIMTMWCIPVYVVVCLRAWLKKRSVWDWRKFLTNRGTE